MRRERSKILLVEDNPDHAELIRRSFSRSGSEQLLLSVESVTAAKEFVVTHSPVLIICDYLLADGNGLDLLNYVTVELPEKIPFVLMTSHGDEAIAVSTMKAGAADYLVKSESSFNTMPDLCRILIREHVQWQEKERAQVELSKAYALFQSVTETAPDGIFSTDAELRITFINPSAASMLGYAVHELLGESVVKIMPERYHAAHAAGFVRWQRRSTDSISRHVTTSWARRSNGEEFPVELSYTSWRNGESLCFTAIIRDVSEKRKLQDRLALSERMEAIGRLAGGIAHDFNNKLLVIMGYAEILRLERQNDPGLLKHLQEITRAAEQSGEITRQLLAFSRQDVIAPKPLDINKSIVDAQKGLSRLVGEDYPLMPDLAEDLWITKIEPVQVDQIMMNMVANARDAMPGGGTITITTRNVTIPPGVIDSPTACRSGDYIEWSFRDAGHGMNDEVIKHIFEPFYTTKDVGKGTGLGLATTYGIVTRNGGFIEVASEVNQGTTFKIYLPRITEELASGQEKAVLRKKMTGTILLVEDDEIIRQVVAQFLEHSGYTIVQTPSPAAAVALFEGAGYSVDLIISDVIMPGMNGRDMVSRISVACPDVKVLFMSGYTSDVISRKGVSAQDPEINYIQKPFGMEQLLAKVSEVLSRP